MVLFLLLVRVPEPRVVPLADMTRACPTGDIADIGINYLLVVKKGRDSTMAIPKDDLNNTVSSGVGIGPIIGGK